MRSAEGAMSISIKRSHLGEQAEVRQMAA
jgi:hypothetical protein